MNDISALDSSRFVTHEVDNQPPPLEGVNVFTGDPALAEAVRREGAGWAEATLTAQGATAGQAETIALGASANANPPQLRTHDRYGRRLDTVDYHPAYHELMALGCEWGVHTSPWAQPQPGAHVARAAAYLLFGQIESGTQCPLTMTYAATPVLARHAASLPALAENWLPKLYARAYDSRFLPIERKSGATIGMGMTEKQGGSDVRSNSTRAEPLRGRGPGEPYRIVGHKWFMSAPMCDAFLILAQAPGGLSCLFLPRWLPDGQINPLRLQRLKDKLGNKSNASCEVEFHGATAWLIGDEGRGVPTILEMVNYTRLDCGVGSAAVMRQALVQAMHHARHRSAFGRQLSQQPLMRNVLADLAIESEAATALVLRLARAYDRRGDAAEAALARLLTPAVKYWICKRLALFCQEAMEVLGGNGYVEESIVARLYREAPLNSIWEGSGNVMCLDVLRAAHDANDAFDALFAELRHATGADARFDRYVAALKQAAPSIGEQGNARRLAEHLALAMQGALLLAHAPAPVADAFCASRLAGDHGGAFGTLPAATRFDQIIERALPPG